MKQTKERDMANKKRRNVIIIIVCVIVLVMLTIITVGGIVLWRNRTTEFEKVIQKLEYTLQASSYEVQRTYTVDELQYEEYYVAATWEEEKLLAVVESEYYQYTDSKDLDSISYNQTEMTEYYGPYDRKDSEQIGTFATEEVEEVFVEETFIHDMWWEDGTQEFMSGDDLLLCLGKLMKAYNKNENAVKCVEDYSVSDKKMKIEIELDEFLDWCEDNVEDVRIDNNLEKLMDDDIILCFEFRYDDEYITKYTFSMTNDKSSDRELEIVTEFDELDEENEELELFLTDSDAYWEMIEDIKMECFIVNVESLDESYGFDAQGNILNTGEAFESIEEFVETYTGEEIVAYLRDGEPLPDKTQDWRILYLAELDEEIAMGNFIDQQGVCMNLVDLTGDGIPELYIDCVVGGAKAIYTINSENEVTRIDPSGIQYYNEEYLIAYPFAYSVDFDLERDLMYTDQYIYVYTYDEESKTYIQNFEGYRKLISDDTSLVEEYYDYKIDNVSVSETEFDEAYEQVTVNKEVEILPDGVYELDERYEVILNY